MKSFWRIPRVISAYLLHQEMVSSSMRKISLPCYQEHKLVTFPVLPTCAFDVLVKHLRRTM